MKKATTLLLISIFMISTSVASADYKKWDMKKGNMEKHQALPWVDTETQSKIKELHDSHKEELEALKSKYSADMTDVEKEEMQTCAAQPRWCTTLAMVLRLRYFYVASWRNE